MTSSKTQLLLGRTFLDLTDLDLPDRISPGLSRVPVLRLQEFVPRAILRLEHVLFFVFFPPLLVSAHGKAEHAAQGQEAESYRTINHQSDLVNIQLLASQNYAISQV